MINNLDLLPEYSTENPVWRDYVEVVSQVFERCVHGPIAELEQIRNLTQQSDPRLRQKMLRMLGFDVTHDFLTLNEQKVLNLAYMFSQFYQNNFNHKFPEFLSFVLGRQVRVHNLYTRNYETFYQRPYGILAVDGGEWYKTTHINVSVDLEPDSVDDGQIITSPTRTVQDRITDMFYTYCPLNLVVKDFYFSLNLKAKFFLSADIYRGYSDFGFGGYGFAGGQSIEDLIDVVIDGNDVIYEEGVYRYRLLLEWRNPWDEARYYEPIAFTRFVSSRPDVLSVLDFGQVRVNSVRTDLVVDLVATFAGITAVKPITLIDRGERTIVKTLILNGPSRIPENCVQQYQAILVWDSGHKIVSGANTNLSWYSSDPSVAEFVGTKKDIFGLPSQVLNDGTLTVKNVPDATTVRIEANFLNLDGSLVSDFRDIEIVNTEPTQFVQYILVLEDAQDAEQYVGHPTQAPTYNVLYENHTYQYHCYAYYQDGSWELIYPSWRLFTSAATVDVGGLITVGDVAQTLDNILLEAEYTYRSVKSVGQVRLKLTNVPRYIHPDGAFSIIGPSNVLQNSTNYYTLSVQWTGLSSRVEVKPDEWLCDKYQIDANGRFLTGPVDDRGEVVTIQANFFYDGYEFKATLQVYVSREIPQIEMIDISGSQYIQQGQSVKYVSYTYWSDNARKAIESSIDAPLTWSVDQSFASVTVQFDPITNATVALVSITSNPTSSFITLSSQYVSDGRTYTASQNIAISKLIDVVVSIEIEGPNDLVEFDTQRYVCKANYQSGATEYIVPKWTVVNTNVNVDQVALVNSAGDVNILRNDVETSIKLEAQYFAQKTFKIINVTVFTNTEDAPPELSWIEGLDIVPSTLLPAVYTLWTKYALDRYPIAYGADWTIDVEPDIAQIDSNGALIVHAYDRRVVEITATRSFGYSDPIVATKKVTIPGNSEVGSITISGAPLLYERENCQYQALVQIDGHTIDITQNVHTVWSITSSTYPEPITLSDVGYLVTETLTHPATSIQIQAVYYQDEIVYVGSFVVSVSKVIPMYGVGDYGINTFASAASACTSEMPSSYSEERFVLTVPNGKYGYFLHPEELGLAAFINIDQGQVELWNGAKWGPAQTSCSDPDQFGPDCGPLSLAAPNGKLFYLYRTDKKDLGQVTYQVNYRNL